MDPALLDLIWEVRKAVGSNAPVYVLSGYRSPVTNAALRSRSSGVAQYSQHMVGKALDFYLPDVSLSKLRETALKFQRGGVTESREPPGIAAVSECRSPARCRHRAT
jgi:uncharacterized protein YcbK (DUF882 family)